MVTDQFGPFGGFKLFKSGSDGPNLKGFFRKKKSKIPS